MRAQKKQILSGRLLIEHCKLVTHGSFIMYCLLVVTPHTTRVRRRCPSGIPTDENEETELLGSLFRQDMLSRCCLLLGLFFLLITSRNLFCCCLVLASCLIPERLSIKVHNPFSWFDHKSSSFNQKFSLYRKQSHQVILVVLEEYAIIFEHHSLPVE